MAQEIRVIYEDCEAMVAGFKDGSERLQDIMTEMQSIANVLADGALIGQAGTSYVDIIRSQMCPSLTRLIEHFGEMANDLQKAIDMQRQADEQAASSMPAG